MNASPLSATNDAPALAAAAAVTLAAAMVAELSLSAAADTLQASDCTSAAALSAGDVGASAVLIADAVDEAMLSAKGAAVGSRALVVLAALRQPAPACDEAEKSVTHQLHLKLLRFNQESAKY